MSVGGALSGSVRPEASQCGGVSQAADDFINPFYRDAELPVDPTVEAWARALCIAYGAKPDKLIGFPEAPAWRSWVGYALFAIKAASALGYKAPEAA